MAQIHRVFLTVARLLAVLGGLVLSALVIMTCVSIAGRSLNGFFKGDFAEAVMPGFAAWMIDLGVAPILGDVELVEAGVAFAIFAFLPLCQITGGHAKVDIFTSRMGDRVNRVIQAVVDVVFALVLVLIAWRLQVGMLDKAQYSETTFMLQFPVWWAYAISLAAAGMAALVGIYVAIMRVLELVTGRPVLPVEGSDA